MLTIGLTHAFLASAATDLPPVRYNCDRGGAVIATFRNEPTGLGSVALYFLRSGEGVVLPQGLSADGGRYAAGSLQFWAKGNGATLTRAGVSSTCQAVPAG